MPLKMALMPYFFNSIVTFIPKWQRFKLLTHFQAACSSSVGSAHGYGAGSPCFLILFNTMSIMACRLGGVVVSVVATGPKGCGFEPSQGDVFLRAIKICSTPPSWMGSKAGRLHVLRFYGM
jgi:hypothetical protein